MHSPLLMPRTEATSRPPRESVRREQPRDAEPFARMLAEADPVDVADRTAPTVVEEASTPPAEDLDPWAPMGVQSSLPLVPALLAPPLVAAAVPLPGPLLAEPPTLPKNLEHLLPADVHIRVREDVLPPPQLRLDPPPSSAKTAPAEASEPGFTQAMIGVVEGAAELNEENLPEGEDLAAWLSSAKLETGDAGERVDANQKLAEIEPLTTPELSAPVPQQLRLEIQDSGGRWELDVLRSGAEVHIEVGGDAALKKILNGATRELEQRLGLHGDTLGSVQWRPISASSSTQNDRMEPGDPRGGQQGQTQQDAPQRQAPRQRPETAAETPDKNHHRGLIHRIL